MPKKYTEHQKQKWLELYEEGKTINYIAKKHAKCDFRTVKNGIDELARKQYAKAAAIQILKEKILLHQKRLIEEIDDIIGSLSPPPLDYAILSWYSTELNSVFKDLKDIEGISDNGRSSDENEYNITSNLLKEHLKSDNVWNLYQKWEKKYSSHIEDRAYLQLKIIDQIRYDTSYPVTDKSIDPPFIYSYTTGRLFFTMAMEQAASSTTYEKEWLKEIIPDEKSGVVKYQSLILAKVPGTEETCRANLVSAFDNLLSCPELAKVVNSYWDIKNSAKEIKKLFLELKMLDFVPGRCRICKRLGI